MKLADQDPHKGAQWLIGRVLDSRPRGRGFESHPRHCVVVLEQDTFYPSLVLVQPRKTRPCLTETLLIGHCNSLLLKVLFLPLFPSTKRISILPGQHKVHFLTLFTGIR